jgi:hypothetical protein
LKGLALLLAVVFFVCLPGWQAFAGVALPAVAPALAALHFFIQQTLLCFAEDKKLRQHINASI